MLRKNIHDGQRTDMFIMFLVCIFDSMQMIKIALILQSCRINRREKCERSRTCAVEEYPTEICQNCEAFVFLIFFLLLFYRCCPFHVRINGKYQIPIDRSNACNVCYIPFCIQSRLSTSYNSIAGARIYQQAHIAMP